MVTNGNPYAVALRVRRNCSDRFENDELFVRNLIQYKAHLMHSGYSLELIDKKFVKVAKCKRKDVLKTYYLKTARRKIVQKGRKINFVTGYDPTFPDIRKAIRASEQILRADEECNQVFPIDQAEKGGMVPLKGNLRNLVKKVNFGVLSSKLNVIRAKKGAISLFLMI